MIIIIIISDFNLYLKMNLIWYMFSVMKVCDYIIMFCDMNRRYVEVLLGKWLCIIWCCWFGRLGILWSILEDKGDGVEGGEWRVVEGG